MVKTRRRGGDMPEKPMPTKKEIARAWVGIMSQLCGIDRYQLAEGREKGVAAARVRTGSGFTFEVLLDRGMGIGLAELGGQALSWISPAGRVAPQFYEAEGVGWVRGFPGGLMVTCGLTQVGSPAVDANGERLGQHGRVSYIPAEGVSARSGWEGEDYLLEITGQLREASALGENLLLTRTIRAKWGESRLWLRDVVENQGLEPAPHMILYHFNFGFPLLGPEAKLEIDAEATAPRDADAEAGLTAWSRLEAPRVGYREQVFYHKVRPREGGRWAEVRLLNRAAGLGAYVRYDVTQLPVLVQWKMMAAGAYVLGIEPANCHVEGRVRERERGTLVMLAPGEKREYDLEFGAFWL